MCNYIKDKNNCGLNENVKCPYVYYCTKESIWKELPNMASCKIRRNVDTPKGYYRVLHERHGYLYLDIDGKGITIQNPFDDIPMFVKVTRLKNGGIKLKKYEG